MKTPRTHRLMRAGATVALVALFWTVADAVAQERVVVRGTGAASVGRTATTTGLFGVGVGLKVGPIVQVTAEVGREVGHARISDLPSFTSAPQDPSEEFPDPLPPGYSVRLVFLESVQLDLFATTGLRFRLPTRRWVKPFGDASVGLARVTTRYIPPPAKEGRDTRMLVALGGGVSLPMTDRVAIEVGYYFSRLLTHSNDRNASKLHGGIAVGI